MEKIRNILQRRKVKVFSLFLLCAAMAWFISNLSEQYSSTAKFKLLYVNVPDSLLFRESSKDRLEVKLRTSGFQFLRFNFMGKEIVLDLSKVQKKGNTYFLPQEECRSQIERQLTDYITLLEIDEREPLSFDLYQKHFKKVPIISQVEMEFIQNHILDGEVGLEPSEVTISGPKNEIDSIGSVRTIERTFTNITSNFSAKVNLVKSDKLKNTQYSTNNVRLTAKVAKFSEKMMEVPVEVINLPKQWDIKTFPNKVSLLCKAKINILKGLDGSDFRVVADFSKVGDSSGSIMALELKKRPAELYDVKLIEQEVEFILKKE
ncbi:MAG: YbbR-like domain-containing protein [Sediminicola sp.]|tara:strand:+ start:42365 stop:43321 length:957 start_codon:yes stop_codon:yes gene_type:complete